MSKFVDGATGARPGVGGLPEEVVLALFERYDTDRSGTLSFREFSHGVLSKHQEESKHGGVPAAEYTTAPKKYNSGFDGEAMNDQELVRRRPARSRPASSPSFGPRSAPSSACSAPSARGCSSPPGRRSPIWT